MFSTKYSKDGKYIVAGGGGKNELKVFENKNENGFKV